MLQEIDPSLTPDRLPREMYETPHFFLLESSLPGEAGRWSIAGWSPSRIVTSTSDPELLTTLRMGLGEPVTKNRELPFTGGWIGYLGYEFYTALENKVPPREPDLIPNAVFGFYENFYLYDHWGQKAFLSSRDRKLPSRFLRISQRHSRHVPLVQGFPAGHVSSLKAATSSKPFGESPDLSTNFSKKEYLSAIQKIKNYISAGDCYQVNLSQRFSCRVEDSACEIYQRLREICPAPYSAYLNLGDAQILSSSPECFLKVDGNQVITRPIKGTRRRGKSPEEDASLREELITSAKDRAELLMITDLLRNDLGRVCTKGTVSVPNLLEAESFPQVHHLVSTITGRLEKGRDAIDLLKATFPGGSITGAPKIRAMGIIEELETAPRNVYTGAIGYLSLNGRAEFNVAIRTMICRGTNVYFSSGGGIIADSDPLAEYEETLIKASGMSRAAQGVF